MARSFLALLLIFGFGHPSREPVDPAKGAQLESRLKCDGFGAPEDLLKVQTTFSSGGSSREFIVSEHQVDKCSVETMFQCWHKERTGWHDVWTAANSEPSAKAVVPVGACYQWGSTEPAQYVLTGWYRDAAPDSKSSSKAIWRQATVKQVSTQPEAYEFTDASGGTARLEIKR